MRSIHPIALLACAALLTACSGPGDAGAGGPAKDKSVVTVATHDSFALPDELIKKFESESGLKLRLLKQGDTGTLTNKLVLTKDAPLADAVYGIDNTFASRAYDEKVLADHTPDDRTQEMTKYDLNEASGASALTPVDYSDVCINVDTTALKNPPKGLDDLIKPEYKGMLAIPGANTSSPGLAFLVATIAAKGDQWPAYWKALIANDAKIVPGWTEAYEGEFTQGGGDGTRPIVVSYSSSPPFTVDKATGKPTTKALLDTCFRQVEYAGVLAHAQNPVGAEKFVDFMISPEVQAALPENMYVYPVRKVDLPADWKKFAPPATDPLQVRPAEIARNRTKWLAQWREIVTE